MSIYESDSFDIGAIKPQSNSPQNLYNVIISMSPIIWFDLPVCYGCQFPCQSKYATILFEKCWIGYAIIVLNNLCIHCLCRLLIKNVRWICLNKTAIFGNSQLRDAIRNRSLIPKQIKSIVQCAILTINGIIVISILWIELDYLKGDVSNSMFDPTFYAIICYILSHVGLICFIRFIGQSTR